MSRRIAVTSALVLVCGLALASVSSAQIVFMRSGSVWVMNDDGSGQRQLVSPAQVPGVNDPVGLFQLSTPDVFQNNGQTVVFDEQHSLLDDICGLNCGAVYELSNGSVTRLSGADQPSSCFTTDDLSPRLTEDQQVAIMFQSADVCPFLLVDTQLTTLSLANGARTTWTVPSSENPRGDATFLPTPDPVNPGLLAWAEDTGPAVVRVSNQSDSIDTLVAQEDPNLFPSSLAWSSDGTTLLLADSTGIWAFPSNSTTGPYTHVLQAGSSSSGTPQTARFLGNSTIVFDAGGNIYTIPATCNLCTLTNATALTSAGTDSSPAWTSSATPIAPVGGFPAPTPTPPPTPTPTPTPTPPATGPRPTAKAGAAKVSGTKVKIPVRCEGSSGGCTVTGTLSLSEKIRRGRAIAVSARAETKKRIVLAGRASITLKAGSSGTLKLALDSAGMTLLRRFHQLKVQLTVVSGQHTLLTKVLTLN